MKRSCLLLPLVLAGLNLSGANNVADGKWAITETDTHGLDVSYDGKEIFKNVYAETTYNLLGDETEYTITSNSGSFVKGFEKMEVSDEFGDGVSYVYTTADTRAVMKQIISIYPGHDYIIVSNTVEALDGANKVQSRRMIPWATSTSSYPIGEGSSHRAVWIPFDNEHNFPMQSAEWGDEMVSCEVSALFEPKSRMGVVAGSVDHDKWKSSVSHVTKKGGRLASFECLSGFTHEIFTKDVIPHGKVKGETVSSARFMVGVFDDWREGFNTFADANTTVVPRWEWPKGNPIGWSSWGTLMDHVSYNGVYDAAVFMKENLHGLGFHDNDDQITVSLDSFAEGGLSTVELQKLGTQVFSDGPYRDGRETKQGLNMVLGMYGGMVVWSWTLGSKMEGTGLNGSPDYTWGDVALRHNGEVICPNPDQGACALDPTHPGVRANLEAVFKKWNRWGVKYVKMDFLTSAAREGDSWYDPEVTTGTMAYNYGMKIVRELAEQYGMYVVEAMAPMFPYQYAHGRRTCCDRWGRLGESEFVMNAISYGWWTDRLYMVNDPDQLVMCQKGHYKKETMGENRVRATSGMCTGAYLFGDNFSDRATFKSDGDDHKRGDVIAYPEEARRRAMEIMGNRDINDYVRNNTGSFMPVEGDTPSRSQGAESIFMRDTPQYLYVAMFNWYSIIPRSLAVTFDRLGISPDNVGEIKELWTGQNVVPTDEGISASIPAGDVMVFRIAKRDYSGITGITVTDGEAEVKAVIESGKCRVESNMEMTCVRVCDIMGRTTGVCAPSSDFAEFDVVAMPGSVSVISCLLGIRPRGLPVRSITAFLTSTRVTDCLHRVSRLSCKTPPASCGSEPRTALTVMTDIPYAVTTAMMPCRGVAITT